MCILSECYNFSVLYFTQELDSFCCMWNDLIDMEADYFSVCFLLIFYGCSILRTVRAPLVYTCSNLMTAFF